MLFTVYTIIFFIQLIECLSFQPHSIQSKANFRFYKRSEVLVGQSKALNLIKEIKTPAELDNATIRSTGIVVIDFQKSRCKPCMKIEPELNALSEKFSPLVLKRNSLQCFGFELPSFS